ncbi:MAG: LysM peptidoglycan-binding domain-containing M23 family metallopeptidase [Proteobacteria bacterium]|nr:LysM peptidoglycan-binding domain-containing M23 family metallopeptidase [Pseudomonadota bacterium]
MRASALAGCAVALGLAFGGCGPRNVAPERLLGVWHEVAPGETVESIASAHGADPAVVAELNDLPASLAIADRRELFVPTREGGEPPGTGATPIAPKPLAKPEAKAAAECDPKSGRCLEWPARGEVAARFGAHGGVQHDGIDIVAPEGTQVVAAESGRVVYSGDGIKGYGNMILVKHDGGLITVYAHNAANDVADGAAVARGQKIASVGRTGTATAPHLHFEVRRGETPEDPLRHLPRKEDDE